MSDSLGEYAIANRQTGEYVSKAVPTLAEAEKLLETVYADDRANLMVCHLLSRPPEPRDAQNCSRTVRVDSDDRYSGIPNIPGQGDNSPG
jgi:hypothetical protein